MFGYVIANENTLNEEQKQLYRSHYCGLCRALGKSHGRTARITLSYEMTFLSLFLSSIYEVSEESGTDRCLVHPSKHYPYVRSPITEYAADMNLLLTHHKYFDDWQDNKSLKALSLSKVFERECRRISEQYPRQSKVVQERLSELSDVEKANVLNPDIPSGIFGDLLAEIFVYREDDREIRLRLFGNALGKFIYIMDACMDLKDDIRKKRYNPLVASSSEDFADILNLLMADTTMYYKELEIKTNTELIENILFSGVWSKYEEEKRRERSQR